MVSGRSFPPFMSRDFPTLRVPPAITEAPPASTEAPPRRASMLELRRRVVSTLKGSEVVSEISEVSLDFCWGLGGVSLEKGEVGGGGDDPSLDTVRVNLYTFL